MNTRSQPIVNLIADIGGTNIRLALADASNDEKFTEMKTYQCAEFYSLAEVITLYLDNKKRLL